MALGGDFNWQATPSTRLHLFVDRTVEETTLPDASSYLYTVYGGRITTNITPRLTGDMELSTADADYQGVSRNDTYVNAGAGVKYQMSPTVFLRADYDFRHLDSSERTEDYNRNRLFFRLGAEPYRTAAVGSAARTDAISPRFGGFYGGVNVGHGGFDTKLTGPRGPQADSTFVNANFGDDGNTWGLFIGYGQVFDSWYLGVELEGEPSKANWAFERDPDVRVFSVDKSLSYGGSARIGYVFRDTALFYARIGAVRTEFTTNYFFNDVAVDQDDTAAGLRLGGGVELAPTTNTFLRLDYAYTNYDEYEAYDTFDNSETLFRLGLGARF
jgi:opacity protein-like surface antigen